MTDFQEYNVHFIAIPPAIITEASITSNAKERLMLFSCRSIVGWLPSYTYHRIVGLGNPEAPLTDFQLSLFVVTRMVKYCMTISAPTGMPYNNR